MTGILTLMLYCKDVWQGKQERMKIHRKAKE